VVVNDVEDDFEAGAMQALDHRLELAERARRRVAHVRREEPDRVVAPVVAKAELDQALVVDERVHGQELDRR
jgi:hypothetical protein